MNFFFANPIQNLNSGALAPLKNKLKKKLFLLILLKFPKKNKHFQKPVASFLFGLFQVAGIQICIFSSKNFNF